MKQRPLKMDEYGISYDAYKELYHFCLQYHRKKAMLSDMLGVRAASLSFAPGGSGTSDPVAAQVAKRERLSREVAMIEKAAAMTDDEMCPWIMRAVTTGEGYWKLRPPCGERQFRLLRKRFFFLLSEMR